MDRVSPFLWLGFSIGGFIAALIMPAFIFLVAFGPALGLAPDVLAPGNVGPWLRNPLVRLFWVVAGVGTIYHGLHRFKYVLYDYGGSRHKVATGVVTYGIVAFGSALVLYLILMV